MLWYLTWFCVVVLVGWLFRFRPVTENPLAIWAIFVVACLATTSWSLNAYQLGSSLDTRTLNRRLTVAASLMLGTCVIVVLVLKYLLFRSKGHAAPWVAISKGYTNEFDYVILVISAISFQRRIITSTYAVVVASQIAVGYLAARTTEGFVSDPYAYLMTNGFDFGGIVTNLVIATAVYVGIRKVISSGHSSSHPITTRGI